MRKRILTFALALVLALSLLPTAMAAEPTVQDIGKTFAQNGGTYAVTDDMKNLWMWGDNDNARLGNGTNTSTETPQKTLSGVVAVSVSGTNTAAICTDGSLWVWGSATYGQMGNGTRGGDMDDGSFGSLISRIQQKTPLKVMDDVAAVSCGRCTIYAIKTDGSLWCWGDTSVGGGDSTYRYRYADGAVSSYRMQTTPVKIADRMVSVFAHTTNSGANAIDDLGNLWDIGETITKREGVENVAGIWERGCLLADGTLSTGSEQGDNTLAELNEVVAVWYEYALRADGTLWNVLRSRGTYNNDNLIVREDDKNIAALSCGLALTNDGELVKTENNQIIEDLPFSMPKSAYLELNGGSAEGPVHLWSNENGTISAPQDPVKEGYVFSGWYQDDALTLPWDFATPLEKGLTLYAKWELPAQQDEPSTDISKPEDSIPRDGDKGGFPVLPIVAVLFLAVAAALLVMKKKGILSKKDVTAAAAKASGTTAEAKETGKSANEITCSCGRVNPPDAKFCATCGKPVVVPGRCPSCGHQNDPAAKFCQGCGKPLGGEETHEA